MSPIQYPWFLLFVLILLLSNHLVSQTIPSSARSKKAITSVEAHLKTELAKKNLNYGAPVFFRIFKTPAQLEVWVQKKEGSFALFKTYPICAFSGKLGPKLKEGDRQAPEGFYFIKPRQLNPNSSFHLSMNLGYPNQYDRIHQRTGSYLMIHGNCVSIGCYAMTDAAMNEIFALSTAALSSGQDFIHVHIFPFQLSEKNLQIYKTAQWYQFWQNLKEGYDYFEQHRHPPKVVVKNKRYVFYRHKRSIVQ